MWEFEFRLVLTCAPVCLLGQSGEALCRNIEWPGRHVAKSLHLAQSQYAKFHGGAYTSEIATRLNSTLCNLDLGTSDTCDLDALEFAVAHPAVFKLGMVVHKNISKITRACPTQPCYMASVQVTVPTEGAADVAAGPYRYTAFINSNRDTVVQHDTPALAAPCL